MTHLLAKSLGWIITSTIGLAIAIAIALNTASAGTDGNSLPISVPSLPLQHHPPPAVPEVNTGLVLLPIVFAVLLFAWRQLLRDRVSEK
jgi:hypothetical protein